MVIRVGVVQVIVFVGCANYAVWQISGQTVVSLLCCCSSVSFATDCLVLLGAIGLGKGRESGTQGVALGAGFAIIECHGIVPLCAQVDLACFATVLWW